MTFNFVADASLGVVVVWLCVSSNKGVGYFTVTRCSVMLPRACGFHLRLKGIMV